MPRERRSVPPPRALADSSPRSNHLGVSSRSHALSAAEWTLTCFLVVGFLNSESRFGAIARPEVKVALACGSLGLLAVSARGRSRRPLTATLPKITIASFIIYVTTILATTVYFGASQKVLLVFLLGTIGGLLLAVFEIVKRGSALRVIRATVIVDVVISLATWSGPPQQADGGSHPIAVGFAAGLLFFLAGSRWTLGEKDQILRVGLAILGSAGLYAAFSRSAIIPALGAVAIWWVTRRGLLRPLRVLLFAAGVTAIGGLVWQSTVQALARGDVEAFYSAHGRSTIWARVWTLRDLYIVHGIGLSNSDGSSALGSQLLRASLNVPTENSLLQAFVAGGVIGGGAWAILLVSSLIAIASAPWTSFTRIGLIAMILGDCVFQAGVAGAGFGFPLIVGMLAAATSAKSTQETSLTACIT